MRLSLHGPIHWIITSIQKASWVSSTALSTAAGFLLSLIALFMVMGSDTISRRIRGYGAF